MDRDAALPPAARVAAILVGAVVEEILYRGYALTRLHELTGSKSIALMVTSVVFGAAHIPMWGVGLSLSTVLASIAVGAFFLWKRDLWA
jgi:membrane protease YdiL (CAAX protease family)